MSVIISGSGNIGGLAVGAGVETDALTRRMVQMAPVSSTSGTYIDFIGIPSWVKRITVVFNGVSTNGSGLVQVQLGTSGGFLLSGYLGATGFTSTVASATTLTSGLGTNSNNAAADVRHGTVSIFLLGSNTWVSSSVIALSNAGCIGTACGSVTLSGTLDRVRITTVNGTDVFDAGSIGLMYEG